MKTIYLDHAAATPVDEKVLKAMEPFFSNEFYNPSATYLAAKNISKKIENAREDIVYHLGARTTEFIFTAGGTEANNLAIKGVMQKHPKANVIYSAIEHESVSKSAEHFIHKIAPVNEDGLINLEKLEKLIDDHTVLISIMYANNEIGSVQPLNKISKLISEIRKTRLQKNINTPLLLHSDACQTPSYLDLHVSSLGVDLMTLNSGKIYGPKQFGGLYVNRNVQLVSQIDGGGQESGIRSGTENPASIVGFAKALSLVQSNKKEESDRLSSIQAFFFGEIKRAIPDIIINGSLTNRLPNNLHVTIPNQDNELMLMKLDELGIQCASGSACNASSDELSQTLIAIGQSENQIRSSLRFTMGKSTSINDIEYLIQSLQKIIQ